MKNNYIYFVLYHIKHIQLCLTAEYWFIFVNIKQQAKEEMVLHGMIHRLIEIGRYYGMEINVEKTKVMRISRQPSRVYIMIDQKQPQNVSISTIFG